ncbi:SgcJ/EcaC family oxidoreductase [Spirosoma arcticum]
MKKLVAISLLSVVWLANVNAQTPTDEAAVRGVITAFNKAFNAHDAKAFGAVFAEDADFTNWRGTSAHGRAKIEEFHVPVLTVMYKNGVQEIVDSTVRFIKPDVAVVDVRSEVTGGVTPDGKASPLLKFLLNWTVTKETNGQWLIKVMHNARLPELEATPPNQKP